MTSTPPTDRRDALRRHVSTRVSSLQAGYLAETSSAAASLARLRRAVNSEPGSDPAVWSEIFEGLPEVLVGRTDSPSTHERAAHSAITLFAIHQQSKDIPMHQRGVGFGTAVRRLGVHTGNPDSVLRRFHAVGTATAFSEVLHHARGLITQLRSARIPLDYGRFAVDLADLQFPRSADRVRLAWGRDYYRVEPDTSTTTEGATDPLAEASTS
ncbi:MAG: type I-E CRISPR-associated protein Cse2/CasB [Rhodococcus sp.]|nr:type I-E CRISPR-associated protein Cse2/CasB [Rhodococcus sp. (in: high G+C Gram-positive bacteria)]